MAIARIPAGGEKRIPTTARYLKITTVSGALLAFNEEAGIREYYLEPNSIIENEGVKALFLVNRTSDEIVLEYNLMDMKVISGDTGTVSITGKVTVDKIEQGVNVAASIGSVEILSANTTDDVVDITLNPNEKTLLIGADETRKELTIQLSGDDFVTCRVGSVGIANNRGKILQGGGGQVGSMTHTATDEVYIKNTSANAVTVSIGVEKRV